MANVLTSNERMADIRGFFLLFHLVFPVWALRELLSLPVGDLVDGQRQGFLPCPSEPIMPEMSSFFVLLETSPLLPASVLSTTLTP